MRLMPTAGAPLITGLLVACGGRAQVGASAPMSTSSVKGTQAPASSISSASTNVQATPVEAPDAPAFFVRAGDALMPVACAHPGTWAHGQACVDRATGEAVTLYPPLQGEASTARGKPAVIDFIV